MPDYNKKKTVFNLQVIQPKYSMWNGLHWKKIYCVVVQMTSM